MLGLWDLWSFLVLHNVKVLNCLLNFDFFSVLNKVVAKGHGSAANLASARFLRTQKTFKYWSEEDRGMKNKR